MGCGSAQCPLPRGDGARGAALLGRGTGSCRRRPCPTRHCRNAGGLPFRSFFGLVIDRCGKGSLKGKAEGEPWAVSPDQPQPSALQLASRFHVQTGRSKGSIREQCSDPREGEFTPALPWLPLHTADPARPTQSCGARLQVWQRVSGQAPAHQGEPHPAPHGTRNPFQSTSPGATVRRPCTDIIATQKTQHPSDAQECRETGPWGRRSSWPRATRITCPDWV